MAAYVLAYGESGRKPKVEWYRVDFSPPRQNCRGGFV